MKLVKLFDYLSDLFLHLTYKVATRQVALNTELTYALEAKIRSLETENEELLQYVNK